MGPPPPTPALSLHSTPLLDLHLDASHAVPPVRSQAPRAGQASSAPPLPPHPPKPKASTVPEHHPADDPSAAPPTPPTTPPA